MEERRTRLRRLLKVRNDIPNVVVHKTIAHGTGLETAVFHTPIRVAPDVFSQHFHTNLLHAILVPKKTIFSRREQEVMEKMYCRNSCNTNRRYYVHGANLL